MKPKHIFRRDLAVLLKKGIPQNFSFQQAADLDATLRADTKAAYDAICAAKDCLPDMESPFNVLKVTEQVKRAQMWQCLALDIIGRLGGWDEGSPDKLGDLAHLHPQSISPQ